MAWCGVWFGVVTLPWPPPQLEEGDIPEYANDVLEFRPKAGDMIIWHPRSIHKVDGAPNGWGTGKRRVLGGTVAIDNARYQGKKKAMFSDMGSHTLTHGDPLISPFFPIIYPRTDASERRAREVGQVGRSVEGFGRMINSLFNIENVVQFSSWSQVAPRLLSLLHIVTKWLDTLRQLTGCRPCVQVLANAKKIQETNKPFLEKE